MELPRHPHQPPWPNVSDRNGVTYRASLPEIKLKDIVGNSLPSYCEPVQRQIYRTHAGIRQMLAGYVSCVSNGGARHSRAQHMELAARIAWFLSQKFNFTSEDTKHLVISALIHDFGHGPFSHSLERMNDLFGNFDHDQKLLQILNDRESELCKNLQEVGCNIERIVKILSGNDPLSTLVEDYADRLSYLYLDTQGKVDQTGNCADIADFTERLILSVLDEVQWRDEKPVLSKIGLGAMRTLIQVKGYVFATLGCNPITMLFEEGLTCLLKHWATTLSVESILRDAIVSSAGSRSEGNGSLDDEGLLGICRITRPSGPVCTTLMSWLFGRLFLRSEYLESDPRTCPFADQTETLFHATFEELEACGLTEDFVSRFKERFLEQIPRNHRHGFLVTTPDEPCPSVHRFYASTSGGVITEVSIPFKLPSNLRHLIVVCYNETPDFVKQMAREAIETLLNNDAIKHKMDTADKPSLRDINRLQHEMALKFIRTSARV